MSLISVCVCTYKRLELLELCLESVAETTVPEGVELNIVVIDNDEQASSRPLIDQIRVSFSGQIIYVCEPRRGIPCARNRAIEEVEKLGSEFLIFIDDDEWVEKDWLVRLEDYCRLKGGGSVVSGAVIADLPDNTPGFVKAQFSRQKRTTGEIVSACATNNVIVPMAAITRTRLKFDESFPLAGGTDTIFFHQLSEQGVQIFKCMEAVVHESIPKERATIRWLLKRKYRAGITDAWRKKRRGRRPAGIMVSAASQVAVNMVKSLFFLLFFDSANSLKGGLKAAKSMGTFFGVLGQQVDSY